MYQPLLVPGNLASYDGAAAVMSLSTTSGFAVETRLGD